MLGAAREIVALHVGFLAIHQFEVWHGVVVVGTKIKRLLEIVDALLHDRHVRRLQLAANFHLVFGFGIQMFFRLKSQRCALLHARCVGGGPVDDADGVIGIGIVGIEVRNHVIELLGLIELLHVEVQRRDPLGAADLLFSAGIHVEHLLVLIDGLFGVA